MSLINNSFYQDIKELLHSAKSRVCQRINSTITLTYYEIEAIENSWSLRGRIK